MYGRLGPLTGRAGGGGRDRRSVRHSGLNFRGPCRTGDRVEGVLEGIEGSAYVHVDVDFVGLVDCAAANRAVCERVRFTSCPPPPSPHPRFSCLVCCTAPSSNRPVAQVVTNVAAFCACAGMGQLFVFFIIKEFGSLVNVTVTISRKFFRCVRTGWGGGSGYNTCDWKQARWRLPFYA